MARREPSTDGAPNPKWIRRECLCHPRENEMGSGPGSSCACGAVPPYRWARACPSIRGLGEKEGPAFGTEKEWHERRRVEGIGHVMLPVVFCCGLLTGWTSNSFRISVRLLCASHAATANPPSVTTSASTSN
jgi:hypothetical protein